MRRGAIFIWVVLAIGGLFLTTSDQNHQKPPFHEYTGVIKSIERKELYHYIYVGDGLIKTNHLPKDMQTGEKVNIRGHFQSVLSLKNLDYARYLKAQGVNWTGNMDSYRRCHRVNAFYYWKNKGRIILDERIDFLYRGDGFLVKALLYGDKTELDLRVREDFARTGTAHILALSGFHTGILALILQQILFFISFRKRLLIIGVFLMVYSFFTGLRPSIIRATVFFFILYGSFFVKRPYDLISASALTASFFILYNPYILYDIGYQLSFLSVVSIGMFLPLLESIDLQELKSKLWKNQQRSSGNMQKVRMAAREVEIKETMEILGVYKGHKKAPINVEKNRIRQWVFSALRVSLAAQILTAPVVLYHFYQLSVIGIFMNIVVLPWTTLLMIGFLLSLFLWPLTPIAQGIAVILRICTKALLDFVEYFGQKNWASWDVEEFSLSVSLFMILGAILLWVIWENKQIRRNQLTVLRDQDA